MTTGFEPTAGGSPTRAESGGTPAALDDAQLREYVDFAERAEFVLGLAGEILWINRKGAAVFGGAPEELVGRKCFEALTFGAGGEELRAQIECSLKGEAEQRSPRETRVVARTGEERWLSWHAARVVDKEGRLIGTLVSGRVIEEPRATEAELRRSLRELTDIKRALDESSIVAITDRHGRITYANDKFCEISGYSAEELIGQDHRLVNSGYHPKAFMRNLWETITSGQVWRGDLRNRAKNGRTYWVSTTIVPFMDADGKPYQYLAIRNDITDRKLVELELEGTVRRLAEMSDQERTRVRELRKAHDELVKVNRRLMEEQTKVLQAEKLSSIGMLASGVAHEINNPLSGVMGCLKALESGSLGKERQRAYFQAMRDGLERIRVTVQGLLDYARERRPHMRKVDLAEVVESSLRLLQPVLRKKVIEVRQLVTESTHAVHADFSQLMQALVNVVLNAIHAAPVGSGISIEATPNGELVDLRVTDEGPGIPAELISRICDPFFTTKPEGEGTGLGLSVTLAIVKSHGGELTFDSAQGKGTTVTLSLPVV